jgi:hypothetical protein
MNLTDKLLTLLVGHLVVFYWRGTWLLIDFCSNWETTIVFSLLVGFCLLPLRRAALSDYELIFALPVQDATTPPVDTSNLEITLEGGLNADPLVEDPLKADPASGVEADKPQLPSPEPVTQERAAGHTGIMESLYLWLVTYVSAFTVVNAWRGIWYALDECLGTTLLPAVASHIVATLLLLMGGRLGAAHAPPALVGHDTTWAAFLKTG